MYYTPKNTLTGADAGMRVALLSAVFPIWFTWAQFEGSGLDPARQVVRDRGPWCYIGANVLTPPVQAHDIYDYCRFLHYRPVKML